MGHLLYELCSFAQAARARTRACSCALDSHESTLPPRCNGSQLSLRHLFVHAPVRTSTTLLIAPATHAGASSAPVPSVQLHSPPQLRTYNPQALLAAVCRLAPQFKERQQHDAHELLHCLLDGLQVGAAAQPGSSTCFVLCGLIRPRSRGILQNRHKSLPRLVQSP